MKLKSRRFEIRFHHKHPLCPEMIIFRKIAIGKMQRMIQCPQTIQQPGV